MADEPFVFYSGKNKATSSLSWSESAAQTYFFSANKEVRKALAQRKELKPDRLGAVRAQLGKSGGVLFSASALGNGDFSLRIEAGQGGSSKYQAPAKFLIFGAGAEIEWREFAYNGNALAKHQFALVPVDSSAEDELKELETSLMGLPEDLRGAILRAMARSDAPAAGKPRPAWIPALLGLGLGLICAGAAYAAHYSLEARSRQTVLDNKRRIAAPLGDLETALKNSPDPLLKDLYASHVTPLLPSPDHDSKTSATEALLVLKLALYKMNPKTETGWTGPANTSAVTHADSLDESARNAVEAVGCLGDAPLVGAVGDCAKVNWQSAPGALQALANFALQRALGSSPGAGATPPSGTAPAPAVNATNQASAVSPASRLPSVQKGKVVQALASGKIVISVGGKKQTLLVDNETTYTGGADDNGKIADSQAPIAATEIQVGDTVKATGKQTDVGYKAQHLIVVKAPPKP